MILDDLAPRIEGTLKSVSLPGCSLAIVGAGGVREARGFGFADLREKRTATEATTYHFCSVTKLLTATGILRLVEQGRFGLEDEVARLLPELRLPPGITVRHLLNHTSALKDDFRVFLKAHFAGDEAPALKETLKGYVFRVTGRPGTRVAYCNAGFMLLGVLIERSGGGPVTSWMTDEILRPIGMKASFRMLDPDVKLRAATGYIARWDLMKILLRLGIPETMKRLCGETVSSYTELRHYDLDAAPIGGLVGSVIDFAAFVRDQAPGYTTEVRLYPKRKLGIVFASNRFAKRISRAFHPIFDALAEAPC
jgi:CubicO group peptidase (beta-lactamase class C family)